MQTIVVKEPEAIKLDIHRIYIRNKSIKEECSFVQTTLTGLSTNYTLPSPQKTRSLSSIIRLLHFPHQLPISSKKSSISSGWKVSFDSDLVASEGGGWLLCDDPAGGAGNMDALPLPAGLDETL